MAKNTPPSIEGDLFFYLTDGLGSTLRFGSLEYPDYDAFGSFRGTEVSMPVTNEFKFTGEQVDDGTGLIYLRARYYDPATGRFVSRDPFPGMGTIPSTLNRYTYGLNQPNLYVDPLGLWPGFVDDAIDTIGGCVSDPTGCAEDVGKGAAQTVEAGAYGGYYVSHEALGILGELPDLVEVAFVATEVKLTLAEGGFLAIAAVFDYIASGDYTNVYDDPLTGERQESDIWPDWLVKLLGGDPAGCYEPCGQLPGISPHYEGGVSIDFQWPLGE